MPVVLALLSCLVAAAAAAQPLVHNNTREVIKIAPDVYQLVWTPAGPNTAAIGSSIFIINDRDVIVVDTGFTRRSAEAAIGELRALTTKPVSLIVNTHWHNDHNWGNAAFLEAFPGAEVIGHPETAVGLLETVVPYNLKNLPEVKKKIAALEAGEQSAAALADLALQRTLLEAMSGEPVVPTLGVADSLIVTRGARRIEIRHLGVANTRGDLVVFLPEEKIAISGDMAITPMQFAFFSSPSQWIGTLDKLATIGATTWVPGHGPAQRDAGFIRDLQDMLRSVVAQVSDGVRSGKSVDELKKTVVVKRRPGSVYEKASERALDALFRIPAIESAFNEMAAAK